MRTRSAHKHVINERFIFQSRVLARERARIAAMKLNILALSSLSCCLRNRKQDVQSLRVLSRIRRRSRRNFPVIFTNRDSRGD